MCSTEHGPFFFLFAASDLELAAYTPRLLSPSQLPRALELVVIDMIPSVVGEGNRRRFFVWK